MDPLGHGPGQHVERGPAEQLGLRQPGQPGQRLVDPGVAQLGVEDADAQRGGGEQAVQGGEVLFDGPEALVLDQNGENERGAVRVVEQFGAGAELDGASLAVAQGEPAGPAAVAQQRVQQVVAGVGGAVGGDQAGQWASDGLGGVPAEDLLRHRAPEQDPAFGVQQHHADAQRLSARAGGVRAAGFCAHALRPRRVLGRMSLPPDYVGGVRGVREAPAPRARPDSGRCRPRGARRRSAGGAG